MDAAIRSLDRASDNFRFAAAVAAFAQQLRGGDFIGNFDYADVVALARSARGDDPFGYRGEFLSLVNLAESLSATRAVASNDGSD